MTRRKKRSSLGQNKNRPKRSIEKNSLIQSQNKNKSDSSLLSTREQRRRRKRKKRLDKSIYMKRRIGLGLITLFIILIPSLYLIKKLNTYNKLGYPAFRDEVLDDLSKKAFVSSTEGRSLTSAEKSNDFDQLFETIVQNIAVDEINRESFDEFVNKSADYKKKITSSKTDQDFFLLVGEYLGLINDSYIRILDKSTYDDLFNYYKNKGKSNIKELIENPQVVNRYKRIINDKNDKQANVGIENGSILRVTLPTFNLKELNKTMDDITKAVTSAPGISIMIIDLEDNNSVNNLYVNEFAKYFIHQDYSDEDIYFYRGKLFEKSLADIKENEDSIYSTSFIKNLADKYQEKPQNFNIDDYVYYDKISQKIKKDMTFANRRVFVLTNQNTANEAIKLASILKESGAYIVKNALDPNPTANDRVYGFKASLFVLDHSGLIISINAGRPLKENIYLDYDQRINSKYPISSILSIIG